MENITLAENLKTENAALKAEISGLKLEVAELTSKVQWFIEQIKFNRKQQFGASSEKSEYDFTQVTIFNEAEFSADPTVPEPKLSVIKEHYRKTQLITDKLPPEMPVEIVEHTLPDDQQVCPECGEILHKIGKETIREELKIIPAKAVLVKHIRHSYGCRKCELESEPATIIKAPVPEPVIKGSFASPESVAHIMVQKFVTGVPLYRQEREFERQGILLSRQTMSNSDPKIREARFEIRRGLTVDFSAVFAAGENRDG